MSFGVLSASMIARKTGNLTANEATPPIAVAMPPDGPRTGMGMGVLVPVTNANGITGLTFEVLQSANGTSGWASMPDQAIRALSATELASTVPVLIWIPFFHSQPFVGLKSSITGTITGSGAGVVVAAVMQNRGGAGPAA